MVNTQEKIETRGRKKKVITPKVITPSEIKLIRGNELSFNDSLFQPFKTNTEIDVILSTEGGLMPGISLMIAGGPGSGKSTIVLDMLTNYTEQGYKCLLIQGEMGEIGHYKYCKRIPKFGCVQTLFLKNYIDNPKETIEYVFNLGYNIIAIDSIAEVLEMYRDQVGGTIKQAESWFIKLQDNHKKGNNLGNYYTSFINIQQFTKGNEFAGSNRLKHMMEAYCQVEKSKDGLERTIHFDKNRDGDKDFKIYFSIHSDNVHFTSSFQG